MGIADKIQSLRETQHKKEVSRSTSLREIIATAYTIIPMQENFFLK